MGAQTETIRRVSLPMIGGRVVHLALLTSASGEADLLIGAGFDGECLLKILADGVRLPLTAADLLADQIHELIHDA